MRVAILAPFPTPALKDVIPGLPVNAAGFPKGMGGSCIATLVEERLKRGWPTDVITLDPSASEPIMRWDGGMIRLWVVRRRTRGALRDGYRREVRLLHQALQESQPDVCHANWTYEYGLAAVTQHDYPVVLTVHDHAWNCLRKLGIRYLPLFVLTNYVRRRAHWTTTVSPYLAEYLERILKRNVPVVPNLLPGIAWQAGEETVSPEGDEERSAPRPSRYGLVSGGSAREIRLVSAVNWSRLKNLTVALTGVQAVRRYWLSRSIDVHYSLMGPGMEPQGAAYSWARAHDCTDGVSFLGSLPYEQALNVIRQSDMLLHPSLEESFGLPVAEAMAMGVPVIACREAQGCCWLLGDGECGILLSGRQPETLAAGIHAAIRGQVDLEGKRINAQRRIRQLCDPSRVLAAYEDVYRHAMHG